MSQIQCKACGALVEEGLLRCSECGKSPTVKNNIKLSEEDVREIVRSVETALDYKTITDNLVQLLDYEAVGAKTIENLDYACLCNKVEKDLDYSRLGAEVLKKLFSKIFWILTIISMLFGIGLWQIYNGVVEETELAITKRVNAEFETPRIRQTLTEVASAKSEAILQKAVNPAVKRFQGNLKEKQEALAEALLKSHSEIQIIRNILINESLASKGYRSAFNKLLDLSLRQDAYGNLARESLVSIIRSLKKFARVQGIFWGKKYAANGKPVPASQVPAHYLFSLLNSKEKTENFYDYKGVIEDIVTKSEMEILIESHEILQTSDWLPAIAATCGILERKFPDKFEFMDVEGWIKFCGAEIERRKSTASGK